MHVRPRFAPLVAMTKTWYTDPAVVVGTMVIPVSPNVMVPVYVRSTHCPGLRARPPNLPSKFRLRRLSCPVPHDAVLVLDVVVVDADVGITGTKARMFQWLAMKQANFCQFPAMFVQGWFHPVAVSVVVVVVVDPL